MSDLQLGGRGDGTTLGTIGGTSWGALLGLSKWKTAHDIWLRVKGLEVEKPQTEPMAEGIRLEPIVADLAQAELGGSLTSPKQETIRWPPPFNNFSSSVDRLLFLDGELAGPVELKTMSSRGTWGDGPPDYLLQLQSYIWCTHLHEIERGRECNWGALVGLQAPREVFRMIRTSEDAFKALEHGAATLHVNVVERDPGFMLKTVPHVIRWWKTHIEGDTPPPVDETESCTKALRAHYGERSGEVEATEGLVEIALEREKVRAQIDTLSKLKTKLDNELRKMMGEATLAATDDVRVSITNVPGALRFDQKALKDQHPLIYKRFQKRGAAFDRISVWRNSV